MNTELLQRKPSRGPRFQKFHERAESLLKDLLVTADHPLTLREMQTELHIRCGLKVSRSSLARYLRERLGATFRLIKPITKIQNMTPAVM